MYPARTTAAALVLLGLIYGSAYAADAPGTVIAVTTRSGSTMRALVESPFRSDANLILLAGGDGKLGLSDKGEISRLKNSFLVRSRSKFRDAGFVTALADAPLDRHGPSGLLGGFRASADHADDLARLAEKLAGLNGKPVVVIGTSRGTVSVANLAARNPLANIRAVVMTSSLTGRNKRGAALPDIPLGTIKLPVLFVHNVKDGCKITLLDDLKPIITSMMVARVAVDLVEVTSTQTQSDPCKALSPHGFLGIEDTVVSRITEWIRKKL